MLDTPERRRTHSDLEQMGKEKGDKGKNGDVIDVEFLDSNCMHEVPHLMLVDFFGNNRTNSDLARQSSQVW